MKQCTNKVLCWQKINSRPKNKKGQCKLVPKKDPCIKVQTGYKNKNKKWQCKLVTKKDPCIKVQTGCKNKNKNKNKKGQCKLVTKKDACIKVQTGYKNKNKNTTVHPKGKMAKNKTEPTNGIICGRIRNLNLKVGIASWNNTHTEWVTG